MPSGTATKLGDFGASKHGVRTQFGWKTRVELVGLNLIYLQVLWSKSCLGLFILPTKRYIWYSRYAVKALTLTIVDLKDFIILYLDPYLVLQTVPAWVFASFPYLQTALAI
jgi:hypothetical protein